MQYQGEESDSSDWACIWADFPSDVLGGTALYLQTNYYQSLSNVLYSPHFASLVRETVSLKTKILHKIDDGRIHLLNQAFSFVYTAVKIQLRKKINSHSWL